MCKCEKYHDFSTQLLRQLKANNARLHKKVTQELESQPSQEAVDSKKVISKPVPAASMSSKAPAKLESTIRLESGKIPELSATNRNLSSEPLSSKASGAPAKKKVGNSEGEDIDSIEEVSVSLEEALEHLSTSCGLDCTNISTLLSSVKWQEKVDGIGLIKIYAENNDVEYKTVACCVTFFGQQTSNYKISNINVLKALIECFSVLLKKCKDGRSCRSVVLRLCDIVADKFGDKKIQPSVEDMFSSARSAVGSPLVIKKLNRCIESSKSPAVQQSYLQWLKDLIAQNGVGDFPVLSTVPMLLKSLDNKNATIRTASIETLGALYSNLGPPLLSFLNQKDLSPQLRSTLEAEFQRVGFVPTENKSNGMGSDALPRKDIMETVDKNILTDLNTTEGKDSWQVRKAALEKVLAACEGSGHYLDYSKSVPEMLKVLKARLYDTQSNLKPLAASVLGHLIISFEPDKAIRVLKQMGSAILEGLVDNKKQMREATVAALNLIISLKADNADKALFSTITGLSQDALNNTIGRQEIIPWFLANKELFNGDCNELVPHFIGCLQDKVALVRSGTETCLAHLLSHGNITKSSVDRVVIDLAPAAKRAIQLVLDRLVVTPERVIELPPVTAISEKRLAQPEVIIQSKPQSQIQPDLRGVTALKHSIPHSQPVSTLENDSQPMDVDDDELFEQEQPSVSSTKDFHPMKSISSVVASIQWPSNPKGEDYLGLLAEWQAIRSHQSLDVLFGDFNSDDQIEKELASIISSSPEELPLVAYWLMYNFASYNNASRLLAFGVSAVRWIKAITKNRSQSPDQKIVQPLVASFILCYGRSNSGDGALRHALREFIEEVDKCMGSKVTLEVILSCLDIANAHSKEFCADSLIWLIMNDGIAHCSRIQITQLFQYLNIEVKLSTASLKAKWKLLVESIVAKVGDFHKLSTILKWEPKELFLTLNISLVDEQDNSQLQFAKSYLQTTVSKVYVAMDVLLSSSIENIAHSYHELIDLLRKLYDNMVENRELLLDGQFFLKTSKVILSSVPGLTQIIGLIAALFVACSNKVGFVVNMSESTQEATCKMFITILSHYSQQESISKLTEMMVTSFVEQLSCSAAFKLLLTVIDSDGSNPKTVAVGTKLLLFKTRQSTTAASEHTGQQQLVHIIESMAAHYANQSSDSKSALDLPVSLRSVNATLKLLVDLVGNSALHKALTRSNLVVKESIVRTMILKIVSTSSDSDGLNTELVSIIKEVTTSIDKVEAVRKLFSFKQSNPNINVDLHLLKLSSAFRNFVEETMQRLAAEDKTNTTLTFGSSKAMPSDDNTQGAKSQTEAFRLIHNLKKLPSQGIDTEEYENASFNEPTVKEQ
jgi:hypothetical protein